MRSASVGFHCPECVKSSGQKVYRPQDLVTEPRLTYAIIAINVLVFFAQMATGGTSTRSGSLTRDGVLFGPLVEDGELWRIVTSGFLHGSIFHIGFNMYLLYIFGSMMERGIGPVRTGLIYAGGLFGGAAGVLLFNFGAPTLGASGAVLGLAAGAGALLATQGRIEEAKRFAPVVGINVALPLLLPGISLWGHVGGIVGGAAVGVVLALLVKQEQASKAAAFGVVLALAALSFVAAMTLGPSISG